MSSPLNSPASRSSTAGPSPYAVLTDGDLQAIIRLIHDRAGIVMDEEKRHLILNRLQRRIRALGMDSFKQYLHFVNTPEGADEMGSLVDALTTNHTRFFREPQHFEHVVQEVLPAIRKEKRTLRIWCAASSSGEEPYSLSMTLFEAGCTDFTMLASDLSTKVLREASDGIYSEQRASTIPAELLHRYFNRGVGEMAGKVRVSRALRERITYRQLNLLEVDHLGTMFDLIFCRNVMIYFDLGNRQRVVSMLERHLAPGGTMFLGLCESLSGIQHGLRSVGPASFRKGMA